MANKKYMAELNKAIKKNDRIEIMKQMVEMRNAANREITKLEKQGYKFTEGYKRTINRQYKNFTVKNLESYKAKVDLNAIRSNAKPPKTTANSPSSKQETIGKRLSNKSMLETARSRAISVVETLEKEGYTFEVDYKAKIYAPIEDKNWQTKQAKRALAKYNTSTIKRNAVKYKTVSTPWGYETRISEETASLRTDKTRRKYMAKKLKEDMIYTMAKLPSRERALSITDYIKVAQRLDGNFRANNRKYVKVDYDKLAKNVNKYLNNMSDETFMEMLDDYAKVKNISYEYAVEFAYTDIEALGEYGAENWRERVIEKQRKTMENKMRNKGMTPPTDPNWYLKLRRFFGTKEWQEYRQDVLKYKPEDVYTLSEIEDLSTKYDGDVFIRVLGETHDIQQALNRSVIAYDTEYEEVE